jgi:outer membrane protein assembly factor BamB
VVTKKVSSYVLMLAVVAVMLCIAFGAAYASGRAWSPQVYDQDKGVAVIGNENNFSTVYGISISEQKRLWQTMIPESQKVSVKVSGDVVYLVGQKDQGNWTRTIKAHSLTHDKVLWSTKIKGYTRVTPVYETPDSLYFGAEVVDRNNVKVVFYSVAKSDGAVKWSTDICYGTLKDVVALASGDYIVIVDAAPSLNTDGSAVAQRSIQMFRIDAGQGELLWDNKIDGLFASAPKTHNEDVYFVNNVMEGIKRKYALYAMNSINGEVKWYYELPEGLLPFGDPVFDGDKIVLLTDKGKVLAFDTATSEDQQLLWEVELGAGPTSPPVMNEETSTMYLSTNKVVDEVVKGSVLVALDLAEGVINWNYETQHLIEPPLKRTTDELLFGHRVQVEEDEKTRVHYKVTALNPEDGTEIWTKMERGLFENELVVHEDTLYMMIQQRITAEGGREETAHNLFSLNRADGSTKWVYKTDSIINTPLYFDQESVRFGTKGGHVISVKTSDGSENFKFYAGKDNEIDTKIAEYRDESGKAYLGFGTQKSIYYIIDDAGNVVRQWTLKPYFAFHKLPIFFGALILGIAISWFIYHAKQGKEMFIRRIAGLNAIDEAVGRSTEMGKPIVYVTGLADVEDIQTLASLSIMGHIAHKAAEYDTPMIVPCCRSVVMSTAQEVVKESFMKAGRPDTYRRENIYYLTDDQFGYVAGVDGIMMREKPAANFYLGKFFAESLILAETGHSTGAIQIAGTAETSQLPFFVAACDYTLIGEELFAASAYLSRDPMQIGSLKGQDVAKAIILLTILAGCGLWTLGYDWIKLLFSVQ